MTTTEEQHKRWVEHFQHFLNRPPQTEPPKSNKAAGPDNIPAEVLRADISTSVNMLHGLLLKIWDQEYISSEWRVGILVKLAKKGDFSLTCKKYRGIMLLSTAGTV